MTPTGDTYIHGHSDSVLRSHRWRTASNSAAYLLPHLREGFRLLDAGCGPGTLTVDLARHLGPTGEVIGVDMAEPVITEASAHAAAEGVTNVAFRVGDFRTVGDLGEGTFDVVHAHQVLQHLRDPVGALAAMGRLARPGGIVAARDSDYPAFVWTPADPRLDRWLEVYVAVSDRNGAAADAGRRLLRWALDAGFAVADVTYTTSTWTFATPGDRAWWGDLWAERTVSSSLATQAIDYGVATRRELDEIAGGWRQWAARPDSTFVLLHGELIARSPSSPPSDR
ncbi:MAG TPA: methyltransferase domain-containing protein [Acidimicrobiia bacterium]|nr:methyltransferase domain-containing protein [Acidimicrobiia bacterium]